MPPRHRTSCGATECKLAATAKRMREYQRHRVAECRVKGESYYSKWRTPEYYAALDALPKVPDKQRARKQEGWQRRRAQKRAVPVESFRHGDVYERDGWVCQLCTRPVEASVSYPDPMSASLDHVVPLSIGGHHVWDNVQLAHLDCNNKKQAQVDWTPEVAHGCSEGAGQPRQAG